MQRRLGKDRLHFQEKHLQFRYFFISPSHAPRAVPFTRSSLSIVEEKRPAQGLHGHGGERWPTEVTSNTYSNKNVAHMAKRVNIWETCYRQQCCHHNVSFFCQVLKSGSTSVYTLQSYDGDNQPAAHIWYFFIHLSFLEITPCRG